MNNRERWVLYPLLLWALAMGFRSQFEYLFERDELKCRELNLVDEKGKVRLRLSAFAAEGGTVRLLREDGSTAAVLVEMEGNAALVFPEAKGGNQIGVGRLPGSDFGGMWGTGSDGKRLLARFGQDLGNGFQILLPVEEEEKEKAGTPKSP